LLTSELQGMTVIDLRKLARSSGVKLSAGIDKDGIVRRLSEALGEQTNGEKPTEGMSAGTAAPQAPAYVSAAPQAGTLYADVTNVTPMPFQTTPLRSEDKADGGDYQPAFRQAMQARTNVTLKQPLRQPAWQAAHASAGPARFGPPVKITQPPVFEKPEEEPRYSELQPPAPRPAYPQQTVDGYRLGYRAAPTRDYGRQDYRSGGYRPATPRTDYQRPVYSGYNQSGYPQPSYAAPRAPEGLYNDAPYKPARDPAFAEPFDRTQPIPEALQAAEGTPASGILEILPDGYGFLRSVSLLPGKKDIYVSVATIRRYELRTGDMVEGKARPQRDTDKFAALMFVEKINDVAADETAERPTFETLVPIYPQKRIVLESEQNRRNWPMRIINLIAPIGFGQRVMIVAPPEAGKTVLLRELCKAIRQNDADAYAMLLLIDERPEVVTEIREDVGEDAEVFATTFDEAPESQTRVSETMLERAERLVEQGKNVVILLDSLTKLTRAYQATLTQGGRTMTNTVTPAALVKPKRFFGAARNTREGGSLTVIATLLVETGSRVDDIIFEEFKGTANMEVWLNTPEGDEPMFPVIDMQRSGTKKEDLLLNDQEVEGVRAIRTVLGSTTNREALTQLIGMMEKTKNNADLHNRLKDWVALWEKSGYLIRK
jgi:transcription termination factor Rho